jgi:16S rRNA (cytidine1402-2'-O)-methyltransferase
MSEYEKNKGAVYLIPTPIAENTADNVLGPQIKAVVKELSYFLVENIRTARRFISSLKIEKKIEDIQFAELNKNTSSEAIPGLFAAVLRGKDVGIMSEAGCPGIADPGALAVAYAHQHHLKVIPIPGPSSIFLALMASGMSGQSFAFHGYLPIQTHERVKAIKMMEKEACQRQQTQIFMETPYRNNKLLEDLLTHCRPDTRLCIAKNITGSDEFIQTKTIQGWKKSLPDMHKVPVIFLVSP